MTDTKEIINKINAIAISAPSELHSELYPTKLGEYAKLKSVEARLVIIAKYEGMVIVLKELGANTKNLEKMIEAEILRIEKRE